MVLTLFCQSLYIWIYLNIFEAKGHSFTFCNFKNTWWAQPDEKKQQRNLRVFIKQF